MSIDMGPLLHQNLWDTVIILEEVKHLYPRFPWCDIMVPWQALNGRHLTTDQCAKGSERKLTTNGGRGAGGECVEGLSCLRKSARDGYLLQISGAGLDDGGQRLAGGSGEP